MFPSSSYTAYNHAPSKDSYSIMINDKRIEFKFLIFYANNWHKYVV